MYPIRLRSLSLVLALVLGISALLFAQDDQPVGAQVGQLAPDFTLSELNGEKFTLSEQVEQYDVVLLYFFFAAT